MTEMIDTLMRAANAPLIVATAAVDDQTAGCVVGFHCQCSIDPVRYAVWLSKANYTFRVALFATHLGVHFLGAEDHELAALFGGTTGDELDKFDRVEWKSGPDGVPLLTEVENRMVLRRTTVWDDGSDHVCFVGEPVDACATEHDWRPMRLADTVDIDPGHSASGRPTPDELADTPASADDDGGDA